MKAVTWTKYGPPEVLQLRDISTPAPKDHEVQIKVHAATVTAGDCEIRRFDFPAFTWLPLRLVIGITKPRIKAPGQELAGEIEAVGKEVTKFKKGDRVFAATLMRFGAYAGYVCLPETHPITIKPADMSYEEAATLPTGGLSALHFIRRTNIQHGEKVLINGAGGSIGTYAVQMAKSSGAEVTGVDSAEKLDMLCTIGADHVMDYTQEDFTKSGETWDVIIDVVGKSSFSGSVRSLRPNGRYVLGVLSLSGMIRGLWTSMTTDKNVIFEPAGYKMEDLLYLKELFETGAIKPVIDRRYPLEQIAEAHRYVEKGHKKGNIVITIAE